MYSMLGWVFDGHHHKSVSSASVDIMIVLLEDSECVE
jgi:hypothetical protein